MDTSNSTLGREAFEFYLVDLLVSAEQEERELGERCEVIILELVRRLKPILSHITSPRAIGPRALGTEHNKTGRLFGPLARARNRRGAHLYLCEDGCFRLFLDDQSGLLLELPEGFGWHVVRYSDLFRSLSEGLRLAEGKREKNLRAIRSRRQLVDQVLAGLGIKPTETEEISHTCDMESSKDCPVCNSTECQD